VDIHCHLLPGIDDGAKSWNESLAMAEIAVADGIGAIIVTPHQLGNYAHNQGATVRQLTRELQQQLDRAGIPLQVLPGADVRIDDAMLAGLRSGEVLSLGDHRRHVLLELPHELYFPLEPVLDGLQQAGLVGVLSHPERNQGLLKQPEIIASLIAHGCLMQVTAGSLMGTFGPACRQMAEWLVQQRQVHFLATDAHGPRARRPLMRRAFERVADLAGESLAVDLCCHHPRAIAEGAEVAVAFRQPHKGFFSGWFARRKAG